MRSWLAAFTTRGTSFLAAGLAATIAGLLLRERDLVSIGVLLLALPLFSALAAGRARYRLGCSRSITPKRVPAGQTAQVRLRVQNVSRLPTGLLLAEDGVPYALGTRPRYVLNGIEGGGSRDLSYPVRSDVRGKFTVGPLEIRVADVFGLVEVGHSFASRTTFVVTPRVLALPRAVIAGSWRGDGEGLARSVATAGEDDVVPRAYRDGDELRRVHWRSTARYGELMVRREEQQWRNRVLLLLDTRRTAHAGTGAASSFEAAVTAAASIGTHLAREGMDGQLITDTGLVATSGSFEEVLLNSLAVVTQSRGTRLDGGLTALRGSGGLLVAVLGRVSPAAARELAASRRDGRFAIALLLVTSTWANPGHDRRDAMTGSNGADGPGSTAGTGSGGTLPHGTASANGAAANGSAANGSAANGAAGNGSAANGAAGNAASPNGKAPHDAAGSTPRGGERRRDPGRGPGSPGETEQAAMILRAAGWRVECLEATTPLAAAWQRLAMPAGSPLARAGTSLLTRPAPPAGEPGDGPRGADG
jgi:uncharacterized protein (DUF58 family)